MSKPLGPRPNPFSSNPVNGIVLMTRQHSPASLWLGRFGVLFSSKGKIIAAFYPPRNQVMYDPGLTLLENRLIFQWALSLGVQATPHNTTVDGPFILEVLAAIASFASDVDHQFNPTAPRSHAV